MVNGGFESDAGARAPLSVLALLPSRPPSSKTQREAPAPRNHTQKPFVIHQGRVQNEVICLLRGRHDEGGRLDAGVSDAAQLTRSQWMSGSLLSPSFIFARSSQTGLGGVGVGVRQEVELSLPTMLDICMYFVDTSVCK